MDITFTDDMSLVNEVNASNCVNSSGIGFDLVFSTKSLTSGAQRVSNLQSTIGTVIMAGIVCWGMWILL